MYNNYDLRGPTLLSVATAVALSRAKRAAYELPSGSEFIVGAIKTTFSCVGLHSGYYADVDNNCLIFHICHPQTLPDGTVEVGHWSFFCGNQTVFNQMSFTCAFPEEAVPCRNAPDFYYLNNNIGNENAPFLTDDDVARAYAAIRSQ
ncbi:uncharacterized protein LOC106474884 [Limulus polyphemus]|uniref:Uncharacterized protein LOC106474884 n=1 Tax=Limulus polyphemus TaxID=6850 RepID=A0ABM1BYE1_LIMPO|nr:uncharacterized protein LOC106474884 [Limulus polyphemus]